MANEDFRGARFVDQDMSGAEFRDVLMVGVRMRGAWLKDVDIDAAVDGLVINGVDVGPLVEAELDRRHPERVLLRSTAVPDAREAWASVESMWAATLARAAALPEADLHRSVDGEWSFVQTLRHLVFVTDAWFSHAVLGEPRPYHPAGLVADFMDVDVAQWGIDRAAAPSFDEVVAIRADRMRRVREFLAGAEQADLDRVREPSPVPAYPPPAARTGWKGLHAVFTEEWEHHRFAVRDLDALSRV